MPAPQHQWAIHMLHNLIHCAMAILRRIFKQLTQLPVAQAFPYHRHLRRWQMPIWGPRRHMLVHKIMVLMTCAALQTDDTLPLKTTPDVHCVPMSIVSLPGKVSCGMAIHTARMTEYGN